MKNVRMLATRNTDEGLLKAGKNYPVSDGLADELIEAEDAIDLDAPEPEQATVTASEDAATRSKRPRSTRRVVSENVSDGTGVGDE